jgi:hypothetical protein
MNLNVNVIFQERMEGEGHEFCFWFLEQRLTPHDVDRGEVSQFVPETHSFAQIPEALLARIMLACDACIVLPVDSLESTGSRGCSFCALAGTPSSTMNLTSRETLCGTVFLLWAFGRLKN